MLMYLHIVYVVASEMVASAVINPSLQVVSMYIKMYICIYTYVFVYMYCLRSASMILAAAVMVPLLANSIYVHIIYLYFICIFLSTWWYL